VASRIETAIRKAVTPAIVALAALNRKRLPEPSTIPFLRGVHTPMAEEFTLTDLSVVGSIPPQLDGRYIRIGPNPHGPANKGHHWFIGDGMVHGVRLKDGRAEWYRNRYIKSRDLEAKGGPPAAPGPRRGFGDTVNTNVLNIGGKTMALVEASSYPAELDENLETVGYSDFGGGLAGSFTAHPHQCPTTGEHHAITYDGPVQDTINHVVLNRSGKVLREMPIPVRHGPSIHDSALTAKYVVILDLPVTFSMPTLVAGYQFPYRWNAKHQPRIGLLPRAGQASDIIWCDIDPCYAFHIGNAFDNDDGSVTLDACVYETMFDGEMPGPYGQSLGLERWSIDPIAKKVTREALDAQAQEFPRPDERFFTQPHRYLWSIGLPEDGNLEFFESLPLLRHDLLKHEKAVHHFGGGRIPGEFVFVPRSDDAPEGDGWLMGFVIDPDAGTSALEILDAGSLEVTASITIPHVVPPGFHGNWLPN
jgi:carotenoid cleavage dioxygenase-like enzyme